MLPTRFLMLFVLLLCGAVLPLRAQERTLPREQVQHDLRFLQQALYKGHPGVFRFYSRAHLDSVFAAEAAALPEVVSAAQAYVAVSRCVAALGCAHTYLTTPYFHAGKPILPVGVVVLGNKLYITHSLAADTTLVAGSELLSVNGVAAADLLRQMRALRSGDGLSNGFRDVLTSVNFGGYLRMLYGDSSTYNLVVNTACKQTAHKIAALSPAEITRLGAPLPGPEVHGKEPQLQIENQILRILPDQKTAVLTISRFTGSNYKRFYREVFRQLQQQQIGHLVIDVRNNTGGNINNAFELLQHILDEPIQHRLERTPASLAPYLPWQQSLNKGLAYVKYDVLPGPKRYRHEGRKFYDYRYRPEPENNFNGRVYVLANGRTLSSASLVASYLKNLGGATVIGAETGGTDAGNHGKSFPLIELPETGLRVKLPLYRLTYFPEKPDTGRGVLPDVPVGYTIADVLQQNDLEMQAALQLIGQAPK